MHYFFVMFPLETTAVDSESNIQDVFKVQNSDFTFNVFCIFSVLLQILYVFMRCANNSISGFFGVFFCFLFLHSFRELSLQLTNHSAASSSNAGHH